MTAALPLVGLLLSGILACGPGPDVVAAQLSSDNPAVREDTARRARNFDDPAVVAALVEALQDPSEKVRLHAIDSLIALHAREAVPALVTVMQQDDSDEVRKDAIDALGRIGDPQAGPALIALLDDNRAKPPLNAIWAVGQLGDINALAVLSDLRESDDPYVVYNANQALRRLRPAQD
ncbi:MAG: HEAT repeat domain-containing protein [Alphaproteobacteria bacterium]|nr:HEAT repeat domain-containing protein [Alphaproteobacteria bacterium]